MQRLRKAMLRTGITVTEIATGAVTGAEGLKVVAAKAGAAGKLK